MKFCDIHVDTQAKTHRVKTLPGNTMEAGKKSKSP